MRKVLLGDICKPKQWKTISASMLTEDGYPVYGANGVIGKYSEYNHEKETLLITCRGATCGNLNICKPYSYVNGNAMALDDLDESINVRYLYYVLKERGFKDIISGSAQPQIIRSAIEKISILIGTEKEQKEIVEKFSIIEKVIRDRKVELQYLDELIKARFIEMFGDMFLNTMNWPEVKLDSIADIVSGITKGRKIKGDKWIKVPYMAVSNVKDGYIDWTTVKTILATPSEIEQYHLMSEDILITEGGDPDKVGRGAIIHNPPKDCIHQNHIFRVRLRQDFLLPEYMEQYLQQQRSKRYFLRCAKQTTGIASINMRQLNSLPVLLPPIELQKRFADFVIQTDKSKVV